MAIITISRLYGSGGSEVAAQVARGLGWSLLDNTVVDQVAARLGITRAQVAAREERVPSLVERIADALTLGSQEWITPMTGGRRGPTDEQLVEMTRHVVDEAVAAGPLVIVGRGAQAMLAERTDALHVFCHAPRAVLISRVMERERLGSEEATKLVDETNAHREMWVRQHWDRDWKRPENYHLSLNTGWLGIGGAADIIVFSARTRFGL
jgi:cytidylate kinase